MYCLKNEKLSRFFCGCGRERNINDGKEIQKREDQNKTWLWTFDVNGARRRNVDPELSQFTPVDCNKFDFIRKFPSFDPF